jgi:hypothetical protein
MATHALRKIHREAVGISIQYGITRQRKRLEVGPFEWLRGVVGIFRDINFEAAWRMRDGGGEARIVAPSLNLSGGPVETRKVKPGIFRAAGAGELTIGNEFAVVALRNEATDLMPIVKGLRSGDSDRSLAGITRRRHRILKEYLMHAADRVAHGAMGEAGDTRDNKEQCCEKGIHKKNEG